MNEAAFYILDGEGYEVHDGVRYDWKAGDVAIVHNNCVHQHFNASNTKPARALVIKTKPMYMFMNMLFQHSGPAADETSARPDALRVHGALGESDFHHDATRGAKTIPGVIESWKRHCNQPVQPA